MLCLDGILASSKAVLLLRAKSPTQSHDSQTFIAPAVILNHRLILVKLKKIEKGFIPSLFFQYIDHRSDHPLPLFCRPA